MRKIKVLKIKEDEEKKKIRPILVEVPDYIVLDKERPEQIKDWAAAIERGQSNSWRKDAIFFDEMDAEEDDLLKVLFEAVDWSEVDGSWFKPPQDSDDAIKYANEVNQRVAVYERLIAQSGYNSQRYSSLISEPFPAGEPAIAEDVHRSLTYAKSFMTRIKAAEDEIATDEVLAKKYGEIMRKSGWASWTENEVMRSPVWLFQYAKDHCKGPLPEVLHSAMVMMSFDDPKNPWIVRYFKAKKYHPRKTKAKEAC